jgi:hypothetical protein
MSGMLSVTPTPIATLNGFMITAEKNSIETQTHPSQSSAIEMEGLSAQSKRVLRHCSTLLD